GARRSLLTKTERPQGAAVLFSGVALQVPGSESGIFQAVGLLEVNSLGVGFEQTVQAESLVDLIQMVHEVIIADYPSEVGAAPANQAVVRTEAKGQAGGAHERIRRIQDVCQHSGAPPGIEADTVGGISPF